MSTTQSEIETVRCRVQARLNDLIAALDAGDEDIEMLHGSTDEIAAEWGRAEGVEKRVVAITARETIDGATIEVRREVSLDEYRRWSEQARRMEVEAGGSDLSDAEWEQMRGAEIREGE